jgi:hypothetical protein
MSLLQRLDAYGLDDPDNNETQIEDVCNVCDRRVVDHPGRQRDGIGNGSARWPHRRAAFVAIIADVDGCADLEPNYPLRPAIRRYLIEKARVMFGRR